MAAVVAFDGRGRGLHGCGRGRRRGGRGVRRRGGLRCGLGVPRRRPHRLRRCESCWRANSSLAAVFAALRCCPTSTAACAFALAAATLASKAVRFLTSSSQRRDAAASSSALSARVRTRSTLTRRT